MMDSVVEGGNMDCRENRLSLEVEHLKKVGRQVNKLLGNERRHGIER